MENKKVLNNNVIIARDHNGKEIIVMGKGLAFGLKAGDEIPEEKIDKIFSLNSQQETSLFIKLLSEIPRKYLIMTENIVSYGKEKLGNKLSDSIYITLTDHIYMMEERAKQGAYVKNTMLWDIKRLYPEEFKVAKRVVSDINEQLGSSYDEHEAANIALHFVNAEMEMGFDATVKITKVMTDILNIVKYHFRINYDEDSLSYYWFIAQLRFFAQHLFSDVPYKDTADPEFAQLINNKYKRSAACVQIIKKHILEQYQYIFSSEEYMYFTIHIEKVVRDSEKL